MAIRKQISVLALAATCALLLVTTASALTDITLTGSGQAAAAKKCKKQGSGKKKKCKRKKATPPASVPTSPTPQFQLGVATAGNGSGALTSNPAGINCGADCSESYAQGQLVTLTAAPSANSDFSGWTGAGCSGTGTCVVTMDAAKSVTATFTLKSYSLDVTRAGSGTGTVTSDSGPINCGATCSGSYDHGTVVTLTASAGANSTFQGWSGAGCSGTGTCAVTVDAAKSVTATFAPVQRTLTVTKAGNGATLGSVSSAPTGISCGAQCSSGFAHGTVVTLTATAGTGNTFTGWSGSGCSGTSTCQVTMDQARSVTATFALQTFTLTVTTSGLNAYGDVYSEPAGAISCGIWSSLSPGGEDCTEVYDYGTQVSLYAVGDEAGFAQWTGACSGYNALVCTFVMDGNKSVDAQFYQLFGG